MTSFNLRPRLLLMSLLPSAVLAMILVAYFVISGMSALEGELRQRGLAIVRYLAPVSEYGVIAGQLESLQSLAQTTMQQPGVKAAAVVGRNGRILAVSGRISLSSGELRQAPGEPGIVSENERWIAFGAPVVRSLADSDALFDPAGSNATPEVIGQIFVEFDKTELLERQHALLHRGLAIVGVGLLLAAMLAVSIADSLTRPVVRLVRAVRDMTLGQFDTRVAADSFGEFGELERGFNDMAERIDEVHRTMQTRIEETTAQLAFQARHDPLTGLINRREFETRLENAIAAAQAGDDESSLLFIDLDRFKPVNDLCGHLAGDELLRQISRLFQGRLREHDTLARLGGDEFAVILSHCVGSRALQVAEGLCSLTAAYRFIWQDKVFTIGASIGLTPITRQARNVAEVVGAADTACYLAKARGRNQVQVQTPNKAANRRQTEYPWQERISAALADRTLLCDAQPLLPLAKAGEADGHFAEICARLDDRSMPAQPFAALLDAAERYDLAPAIDEHLLETAVAALARAQAHVRRMRCLLPVSAASVQQGILPRKIAAAIDLHGVPAASLYLLISEETALRHSGQAQDLCHAARALGCRIVLGDFGGNYASFGQLHGFAPDCVKISRSLTRDLGSSRGAHLLIQAIRKITGELDVETIAEGVDDIATIDELRTLGITYVQGRAVAPAEPFEHWVEGGVICGS